MFKSGKSSSKEKMNGLLFSTNFTSKLELAFVLTTTTATSVLMPLSRLAGVGNFCCNSLSPFLSVVLILSSLLFSLVVVAVFVNCQIK